MRTLSLCLSLAACGGTDPSPSAANDVAANDAAPDTVPVDAAPDAVAVVDAPAEDAPVAVVDVAPVDAVAVVDVVPEASAPDVQRDVAAEADECGGGSLRRCTVEGVPMCVAVDRGRPGASGTTIHCGMCGNTCMVGFACLGGRCERL